MVGARDEGSPREPDERRGEKRTWAWDRAGIGSGSEMEVSAGTRPVPGVAP